MNKDKKGRLDNLFTEWQAKHELLGYENFIRDGIVNYAAWEEQKTPKVCYFLKEAYVKDKPFHDLSKALSCELWGIWKHKIPFWTQGVYDAQVPPKTFEPKLSENEKRSIIDRIAVVNIKKSNGNTSSDGNDLMKYVREDEELLRRELIIIEPDVIICGYTFHLVKDVLQGMKILDVGDGKWGNSLVIDYYHPSNWHGAAGNTEIHYYALREICRNVFNPGKGGMKQ